jgi:hypothetical protein
VTDFFLALVALFSALMLIEMAVGWIAREFR